MMRATLPFTIGGVREFMHRIQDGPTIEAVIFDFGGVFTESPYAHLEALGAELGLEGTKITELVLGPFSTDGDHPWHRLERGEIPLSQAREEILHLGRERYAVEVDIYRFFERMPRDAGLRHPLVERVHRLKIEGYRTAIVTNNIREFANGWRALLPVEELFDAIIDSSMEGVRKPNPAIFRLALERLAAPPERTLFLDDFEANVTAARSLGMYTILVKDDIAHAIAALDALLGR